MNDKLKTITNLFLGEGNRSIWHDNGIEEEHEFGILINEIY